MFKNDTNDMYSCYNIFLCWDMGYHNFTSLTPEMKLRRAAKARIDRMTKNHPSRSHLNSPEWLKREWKGGGSMTKDEIADVLREANFNKDRSLKKQSCRGTRKDVSNILTFEET